MAVARLPAALAVTLLLAACASTPPAGTPQAVAEGVYLVQGLPGEPGPENRGRVGNAGFIVGPQGVIVVDSGTSYRQGAELLAAVRRVTDRPVRALVLTHTRQEFLFGAAAFREQQVPIHMHLLAARLMAARCEGCLKTLKRVLGEDEMAGTAVIRPDLTFDQGDHRLDLIGRPVRLLHFGHGSGPGDTAVLDESTGTLFAGGLLDNGRVPDVQDSRLEGWTRALAALRTLKLAHVVPGHGPAGAADSVIAGVERYLQALQAGAKQLLDADVPLSQVAERLQLPAFQAWDQYETIHRRNASVVFLRFEQERLTAEPEGGAPR